MVSATRYLPLAATLCVSFAQAERILHSTGQSAHCGDNSQLTASSLNVSITPDNQTITYSINGTNEFSGNASIGISVFLHVEDEIFKSTLDPCLSTDTVDFCPSNAGQFTIVSSMEIPQSSLDRIPDDEYSGPVTEIIFEFILNNTATNKTVGCIQAALQNNDPNSTTSIGNSSSDSNTANGSNGTGGGDGGSGASTTYLSWTLALFVIPALTAKRS